YPPTPMQETSAPVRPSLRCDTLAAVRLPAATAILGVTIRASAASMTSLRVMARPLADSMPFTRGARCARVRRRPRGGRTMSEPLLLMEGIEKSYPGVHAPSGCRFELRSGEVHACVGDSGAARTRPIM